MSCLILLALLLVLSKHLKEEPLVERFAVHICF